MIRSFVFNNGKLVGQDLDVDSMKLVMFDKGLHVWIDLENCSDEEVKPILEGVCNFHPLAIEDCIKPSDLPKVDEYETYLFMVIHAVDYTRGTEEFRTTELNIFMGKDFLVTYHREPLRSITATIDRVQKSAVTVAKAPDRLGHTLLDFLIENYRPVLEELSAEVAELEEKVLVAQTTDILGEVLKVRNEVQKLHQIIIPQRDVIARFSRGELSFVRSHLVPYYRDLHDKLIRINDSADNFREALNNILQIHLNLQQMQVNRVIKVLTVLATLAMPILIITSYYGMNVPHFPPIPPDSGRTLEAYLWIFGVSGLCTLLLYWWLKRKKWL
jgi:magnesium transporter